MHDVIKLRILRNAQGFLAKDTIPWALARSGEQGKMRARWEAHGLWNSELARRRW